MAPTIEICVDGGLGRLVLNHPPLNILTQDMLAEVRAAIRDLEANSAVRVLLVSAHGKHFSAGADVGEHLPPLYRQMIPEFLETVAAIDGFPLPVVAAVQGKCLGGGFEIVQAADIVIAAENASFGQPEIVLGVFPPAACVLLPERCDSGLAADLVLSGAVIEAVEALEHGLIRKIVPPGELEDEATATAQRIAQHSRAALEITKRALRNGNTQRRAAAFRDVGDIYVEELMNTADAIEGLRAFQEKRQPTWSHQ
jgi:cyclohexa-1,5-dienecarbonyl-CoA hydratase